MRTILVDDEPWSMRFFKKECEENDYFDIVEMFSNPDEAFEYSKKNIVEFALLDIVMPEMDGLELGKKLREIHPNIVIIYVTAHDEYAVQSLKQKADYFITKPYSLEDVKDAIDRAKLLSKRQKKRVFIRTFGYFDVFIDGKAVIFKSAKAKELLALLVDRNGGVVSTSEAFYTIWEDTSYNDNRLSLCRKAFEKLSIVLEENKISELIIKNKDYRMLNKSFCDCDYFDFLDGDKKAIDDFNDLYMSNYSWAECTLGKLYNLKHSKKI